MALAYSGTSAPSARAPDPMRDYQVRAVLAARAAYRAGSRAILIVSPTGSGKTKIGAEFMRRPATARADDGQPAGALWIAHRDELVSQARERLLAEGLPRVGVIAAGVEPEPDAPVQVAMAQTLLVRGVAAMPRAAVIVVDEAHHYAVNAWSELLRSCPESTILGLTATPERSDRQAMGRSSGGIFTSLIQVAQVSELQALGHLVPVRTIRPPAPQGELSAHPVDAYLAESPGERAFCFCAHVAHARATAAEFNAAGVPAAYIDEATSPKARKARIEAFRRGELLVLTNVYALTEGVDVPEASVVIIARGCGSTAMFMQMGGRGMRPAPGKTRMLLLDLRGAVYEHDLLEADRIYSLEGQAIRSTGAGAYGGDEPGAPLLAVPSISTCKDCGAVWATGPAACPRCDAVAPPPPMPKIKLAKLGTVGRIATKDEKRAEYARLRKIAEERGYNPHWASHQYRAVFGVWPKGVR